MNNKNNNNNKLRNIFMLGILPSLTLITVMSAVISSNSNIINNKDNNMVVKGDPISYNLSFNPYGLLDSASSNTEKEFITSRVVTYPLTFNYKKAYSDETNKVTKINKGGYIKNFTEIKGINSIRYTGTGSLRLELGYSTSYMEVTNLIINSNEEYVLSNSYNYFSISNSDSNTHIEVSSLSIKYSCVTGSHSESFTEGLKFNYLDDSNSLSAEITSSVDDKVATIDIPDTYLGLNVTEIKSANYPLNKLTTFNIGRYVSSIFTGTFDQFTAITTINVDSNNASLTSVGNVIYSKDMTTLVFAPNNVFLNGYFIPDTVTTIKQKALSNSGSTTNGYVVIPTSVVTVEQFGFYNMGTPLFTYHESLPGGWNANYKSKSTEKLYFASEWHLDDGVPVVNS